MSKPTEDDIYRIVIAHSDCPSQAITAASLILQMIEAWEAEERAETASIPAPPPGAWEYETPEEAWERYNELQRARRKAFAEGMEDAGDIFDEDPSVRAARRYPLKKRVPKPPIEDPHYRVVMWEARFHKTYDTWHAGVIESGEGWPPGLLVTPERVRALAALLDDPWTLEDSTEIEDAQA